VAVGLAEAVAVGLAEAMVVGLALPCITTHPRWSRGGASFWNAPHSRMLPHIKALANYCFELKKPILPNTQVERQKSKRNV